MASILSLARRLYVSKAFSDLINSGKYLRYAVLLVCTAVVVIQEIRHTNVQEYTFMHFWQWLQGLTHFDGHSLWNAVVFSVGTTLDVCSILSRRASSLHECLLKLTRPPVSTHMKVVVNKSLTYPALTICRSPPYKYNLLENYNLSYPRQGSDWSDYPFGNISLEELWQKVTFTGEEVFKLYALNYVKSNVLMKSRLYLEWGQCHTLLPRNTTRASGSDLGYRMILYHQKSSGAAVLNSSFRDGWNIYVHPPNDPWIESMEETEGLVETLYVEVGEEVHINIAVQEYRQLNRRGAPCNSSYTYSQVKCEEECWTRKLTEDAGCSAPWLHDVDLPPCSNFTSMKKLIYGYIYQRNCDDELRCPRPCRELLFIPHVTSRRTTLTTMGKPSSYSTLKVFYTSRLVSVIEEQLTYDWALFMSDLGGSLGFLLGLSVLGIVGLAENILRVLLFARLRLCNQDDVAGSSAVVAVYCPKKY